VEEAVQAALQQGYLDQSGSSFCTVQRCLHKHLFLSLSLK
jgi:hypothetical protein